MVGYMAACMTTTTAADTPTPNPPTPRYYTNLYFDFTEGETTEVVINTESGPVSIEWQGGELVDSSLPYVATATEIRGIARAVTNSPITEIRVVQGRLNMSSEELPESLETLILESGDSEVIGKWETMPRTLVYLDASDEAEFAVIGLIADLPPALAYLDVSNTGAILDGTAAELPDSLIHIDIENAEVYLTGGWQDLPRGLEYLVFGGVEGFALTGSASNLPAGLTYFDAETAAGEWTMTGTFGALPDGLEHFNVFDAGSRFTLTGNYSALLPNGYVDIGYTNAGPSNVQSYTPAIAKRVGFADMGLSTAALDALLDNMLATTWEAPKILDIRDNEAVSNDGLLKIAELVDRGINVLANASEIIIVPASSTIATFDDVYQVKVIESGNIRTVASVKPVLKHVALTGAGASGGESTTGSIAGGGGAGGEVLLADDVELEIGDNALSLGLGGASPGGHRQGFPGNPSSFAGLAADGGGYGGGPGSQPGGPGFNSGGAACIGSVLGLPGAANGGYPGGEAFIATQNSVRAGGGGGGAGGEGLDSAPDQAGLGGPGLDVPWYLPSPIQLGGGGNGGGANGMTKPPGGGGSSNGTVPPDANSGAGGAGSRNSAAPISGGADAVMIFQYDRTRGRVAKESA